VPHTVLGLHINVHEQASRHRARNAMVRGLKSKSKIGFWLVVDMISA